MIESTVFAYFADREWRELWKTHLLIGGYFTMKKYLLGLTQAPNSKFINDFFVANKN